MARSKKRHGDYKTASLPGGNSYDFGGYEVGCFGAPREHGNVVVPRNEALNGEAESGILESLTVDARDIRSRPTIGRGSEEDWSASG